MFNNFIDSGNFNFNINRKVEPIFFRKLKTSIIQGLPLSIIGDLNFYFAGRKVVY